MVILVPKGELFKGHTIKLDILSHFIYFRIPKEGENIYNYRHRCNCKISGSELDDEQIRW